MPTTGPTGLMTGADRPRRPPRAGAASQRMLPLAGAASLCTPLAGAAFFVHAVIGRRGAPAEVANGSSEGDASLASEHNFASKEEDDERDPDDKITGAV